ncbi:MAG: hypothetical protein M1812_006399 [Candelaria pacifica]|nr:MAG: hypothetical protein M1812_006399 [Candelaria pacifica]
MKINIRRKTAAYHQSQVYDDGMEAVPVGDGLEVAPAEWYQHSASLQVDSGTEDKQIPSDVPPDKSTGIIKPASVCGLPSKRFWIILGLAVTLAIGSVLGSTLGTVLSRKAGAKPLSGGSHESAPLTTSTQNPANQAPSPFSTTGAFNGSGIALLDLGSDAVNLFAYYQHHTGQLRSSALVNNKWSGGGSADIVEISDVKNGTPIGAVSYTTAGILTWHVFYVDSSNVLQETINSNHSNVWTKGPVGKANHEVFNSPTVGLTACWNGDYYGAKDGISGGGVRLFYGVNDTAVQELSWAYGDDQWGIGQTITGARGDSGLICAGVGSGTSYLYLQNTDDDLELWWKDFNVTGAQTPGHPSGMWNKGPAASTAIRPHSPISYSNYVYFQDQKNVVIGIAPVPKAESSTWGSSFKVDTATPETQIASTTFFPNNEHGSELHVFFQTNGSDITEYIRPRDGGQFSSNAVPVG